MRTTGAPTRIAAPSACLRIQARTLGRELEEQYATLREQMPDPCVDTDERCPTWAEAGECLNNEGFMLARCRLSCKVRRGAAGGRQRGLAGALVVMWVGGLGSLDAGAALAVAQHALPLPEQWTVRRAGVIVGDLHADDANLPGTFPWVMQVCKPRAPSVDSGNTGKHKRMAPGAAGGGGVDAAQQAAGGAGMGRTEEAVMAKGEVLTHAPDRTDEAVVAKGEALPRAPERTEGTAVQKGEALTRAPERTGHLSRISQLQLRQRTSAEEAAMQRVGEAAAGGGSADDQVVADLKHRCKTQAGWAEEQVGGQGAWGHKLALGDVDGGRCGASAQAGRLQRRLRSCHRPKGAFTTWLARSLTHPSLCRCKTAWRKRRRASSTTHRRQRRTRGWCGASRRRFRRGVTRR